MSWSRLQPLLHSHTSNDRKSFRIADIQIPTAINKILGPLKTSVDIIRPNADILKTLPSVINADELASQMP